MTSRDAGDGQRRRTVLKSMSALGIAAAASSTAPAASAQESEDEDGDADYRQALRDELTASSREARQLPAGSYVYGTTEQSAIDAFSLVGGGTATEISVETDAVPITTAERLEIPAAAEDPSAYAYRGEITDHSFEEGDLLLAVAYVRSDDANARAQAAFGYRDGDSGGLEADFVQRGAEIEPSDEWMRYFFAIEVGSIPDGATPALEFRVGYAAQTIEFGGVALFDYGDSDVDLGTLPPYDYEGRSEDAEWREAARERIEEIRKTDVEVEVLDPDGEPVKGAAVDVEMTEHEFDFGSAISANHVTGDSEDDEIYREKFLENFNKAVIENGLKYPAWEGDWDPDSEATAATLDWLNERDIPTRGHYLLWEEYGDDGGGGMNVDSDLPADELEDLIAEKIREHANRFEGQVSEWDMHNHPVWQSNFRDDEELGWDAVDRWWTAADEATDVGLYTNEMGAIGGQWQREQYYEYISHLVENDYPIDGIGFMGHHQQQWNQMLDIEDMIAGYEQFSEFDIPLLVTEFDIEIFDRRNAQDVAVQADYLRDFLTVAFSMENVEGVLSWGFWEDDHWRPSGAYYDSDWTLREHGKQYQELVFEEWWTDETGTTDKEGTYDTRGFKGSYTISAEKGALSGETTVTLDDETDSVTVELTPSKKDKRNDDSDDHRPSFLQRLLSRLLSNLLT